MGLVSAISDHKKRFEPDEANIIVKCDIFKNPCVWCRLNEHEEAAVSDVFGYPKCCQQYFLASTGKGRSGLDADAVLEWYSTWLPEFIPTTDAGAPPKSPQEKQEVTNRSNKAHLAGMKIWQEKFPKDLRQWGPCPLCVKRLDSEGLGCLDKIITRDYPIGSDMVDFETPFNPVFFKSLLSKCSDRKTVVGILRKFEEVSRK